MDDPSSGDDTRQSGGNQKSKSLVGTGRSYDDAVEGDPSESTTTTNYGYGEQLCTLDHQELKKLDSKLQRRCSGGSGHRYGRRLSTGAMSAGSLYSLDPNGLSPVPLSADGEKMSLRRSSLSNKNVSGRLKEALADSSRGSERSEDSKIDELKELLAGSPKRILKTKRRMQRRSSLSSVHSSASQSSVSNVGGDAGVKSYGSSSMLSSYSSDRSQEQFDSAAQMSNVSLPIANVKTVAEKKKKRYATKTDQIIESLVWFSFHIPRTVLEDLIAHELELWKRNNISKQSRRSMSSRNKKSKKGAAAIAATIADDDSDGSVSSLSDEGGGATDVFGAGYSEKLIRREQGQNTTDDMFVLPKAFERESAILFVDMSGFTKLSTMLDVESLSKVINSYFDMIVSEVILFGGDILKFAGDAFFAEWRVQEDSDPTGDDVSNPLSDLNASLASINEMAWDDNDVPPLTSCVMMAAKCGISIVKKFSDYHVTTAASGNTSEAMLNVHCGVGVGHMVGLHVGDYKEGQEEDAVELRREFLILGEPIDQVSIAADVATDGEIMASPEAMLNLAFCCDLTDDQRLSDAPVCIAVRDESFLKFDVSADSSPGHALQPYESLRMHCKELNHAALQRLNLQMALYVHPVIRADELALSAAIQAGKISQPTETLESRHRAEAELRSVYTMFISPIVKPRITGINDVDEELIQMLGNIMHVTSRELDRYSGHLRQFIVDDKGVVLIATFGLRGSTFPNMVENNCLPATFAIHRALKTELNVESRIGATFGKVYCGVVGGVRRHEFACMGAPVNLAARLMSSKVNNGILVDEAVHEQCRGRYTFKSLPPVKAKGYDNPVPILEPVYNSSNGSKRKKTTISFTGRKVEKRAILSVARGILEEPESHSSMIFLTGESGMGKTALALNIMEDLKKTSAVEDCAIVTARSTSTETEQRIPLSSYRKVFLSIIRERCEHDGDGINAEIQTSASVSCGVMEPGRRLSRRSKMQAASRSGGSAKQLERHNLLTKSAAGQPGKPSRAQRSRSAGLSHSVHGSLSHSLHGALPGNLGQSLHGVLPQSIHGSVRKSLKSRQTETLSQSLHRAPFEQEVSGTLSTDSLCESPTKTQSMRFFRPTATIRSVARLQTMNDDSTRGGSVDTANRQSSTVPYFEKLCWACEHLDYPYEYADIVGSQFLGFESATPITHVDGHVPTMDELVDFLALAFVCIADFTQLTFVFLDDFQFVDAFSWRIFRVICKRSSKVLLMCSTRSHDKQALRRITSAVTPENQFQSQMIEISLGPLDFADIRDLISNVLVHKKSAIPDSLCSDIFQCTGGLPVYVTQLLENIKRMKTLQITKGVLQWTEAGLKQKKNMNGAAMEEAFLSRFDGLDVRVRKVLQTCAVLGLSFELSYVIQVHPEMDEGDIENALDSAIDEMILIEQEEDKDEGLDTMSIRSGSSGSNESDVVNGMGMRSSGSITGRSVCGERYFQFSHAMWRKNVLATMLKERKIELHRLIAESMEKDQVLILEESDISRLLTLFDHWKACGDFCKVAPLALAVGARLEEWDLSSQSLELYEDALEMAFGGVEPTDQEAKASDWVRVKARPVVLDLILRLHICIGLCHQRLGEESQSILFFEDAYNIIKTASKLSGISKSLTMPVISSLCVLKLEEDSPSADATMDLETLIETFVVEADTEGQAIHIARSLVMKASYHAKHGELEEALRTATQLQATYDIEYNSSAIIAEYGRDFAIECLAESVQWLYLLGQYDLAEKRADMILGKYLRLLDPIDVDYMMHALLPIIQVFSLLDRSTDANFLLKTYIINPYHDHQTPTEFWAPMFNPLAYLLEIIIMDEANDQNDAVLCDMEAWVLDPKNSEYDAELERKAHTIMGELCWRLISFKEEDDPTRQVLVEKVREFLIPIAHFEHGELFQKKAAQALLETL